MAIEISDSVIDTLNSISDNTKNVIEPLDPSTGSPADNVYNLGSPDNRYKTIHTNRLVINDNEVEFTRGGALLNNIDLSTIGNRGLISISNNSTFFYPYADSQSCIAIMVSGLGGDGTDAKTGNDPEKGEKGANGQETILEITRETVEQQVEVQIESTGEGLGGPGGYPLTGNIEHGKDRDGNFAWYREQYDGIARVSRNDLMVDRKLARGQRILQNYLAQPKGASYHATGGRGGKGYMAVTINLINNLTRGTRFVATLGESVVNTQATSSIFLIPLWQGGLR